MTMQPLFSGAAAFETRQMRVCITANLVIIALLTTYLVIEFPFAQLSWPFALGALLAGYFVADFVSGVVHWGMDTWFDQESMGRVVSIAREHHTHPQNIMGYSFIEYGALGSAPAAPLCALGGLVALLLPVAHGGYLLMLFWLVVAVALLFGTSFHNLGHYRAKWGIVRLAQRLGLVNSPMHHNVHHRDQTVRYCVINGWANYPCDAFGVWRGLERIIASLTGAVPRSDDIAWQQHYRETGLLPGQRPFVQ